MKKKFTQVDMLEMLEKGYTSLEVTMEKWEIFKNVKFNTYIVPFTHHTCALCDRFYRETYSAICGSCPFRVSYNRSCIHIKNTRGYQSVYDAVEEMYIHELLEKEI